MNLAIYLKKWKNNSKKSIKSIILIILILSSFGYSIALTQINKNYNDENKTPYSENIRLSSTYIRQAAIDYAEMWWDGRNPNYNDYSGSGGDCANFVSQCLIAGGLDLSAGPGIDEHGSIPSVVNLDYNLRNYQNTQFQVGGTEPLWVVKGDPILFYSNDGTHHHSAFGVVGDQNNYWHGNAHTLDCYHKDISWFLSDPNLDYCVYFHINDEINYEVTLTLYMHDSSPTGPILSGVRVRGYDADGNNFDLTTGSEGYMTITGAPGMWHFEASKSGYETNIWDQTISETDRKDGYLIPLTINPPVASIELQQNGNEITNINVNTWFDIYIGGSTDDTGITQVRFMSDESQNGIAEGSWTGVFDWGVSSGDWNANTKIMNWLFGTTGEKEVWVEVIDDVGQSSKNYAGIWVAEGNLPPIASIKLQQNGNEITNINVNSWFDIYVGGSTDDTGITQVRFMSDESQNRIAEGSWTGMFDWGVSSGDWNANTKIMNWLFGTTGEKEVWVEVIDDVGQSSRSYAEMWVSSEPVLSSINQYKSDGVTPIPEGGITYEDKVEFKAVVSDGENVGLEIELKEINEPFNGIDTFYANYYPLISSLILIVDDLEDGSYHWQYRVIGSQGAGASWIEFGSPGNIDFTITTLLAEPLITSSLTVMESYPCYLGDTITGQFTITNEGIDSFAFEVLTIGGRDPDDQTADFTWDTSVILNPGESYDYIGTNYLTKTGIYHFFCAYKLLGGDWNTAIPTIPGILNTLDINVQAIIQEPTISQSLEIYEPGPYYVGDTISAGFSIINYALNPVTFEVLTIGGRDPDDEVADFLWYTDITLNPGEQYYYQGTITLRKTGSYHFFCAYERTDGSWNTAIPTEVGVTNVKDIWVDSFLSEALRVGTTSVYDIDPHFAWDSNSIEIIEQVGEGLYAYDLNDPNLNIIPRLALDHGIWSTNGLEYTVSIRQGITFHDGTLFDAYAVKFSFDRLLNFITDSGGSGVISQLKGLYYFKDQPIINRVEVINAYTVKFILNNPYSAFQGLLCFTGSYILSPSSTPFNYEIDLNTGDLVGTGPFVYDGIEANKIKFHAFNNYWREKAKIDDMIFYIYNSQFEMTQALLFRKIHFINNPVLSFLNVLESDPTISLIDTMPSATIYYLGMNNKRINVDFRKAISYAIDYNYIIENIMDNHAFRLRSPIPEGILYSDYSYDVPDLDLIYARQIMQSMGFGLGYSLYNDAEWINTAINNPFATYKFTYNPGYRENIFYLLQDNLAKIGIKVQEVVTDFQTFLNMMYEIGGYNRDMLDLFWIGWGSDFNDPCNFIDPLFTNKEIAANGAQVSDDLVQQWMEEALSETNPSLREDLYKKIQKRLIEEIYPHAWGYVPINYDAYSNDLKGFQSNPLNQVYFYPCYLESLVPHPSSLFDGMFIDYSSSVIGMEEARVSYSQLTDKLFHVALSSTGTNAWFDVNKNTRFITNQGGDLYFPIGTHTMYWIFTDAQIGDEIPILVDGEGDHIFRINGESNYYLPGIGTIEVWVLEGITEPGSYAWYEKSTGILIKGEFYYSNGNYFYELELVDSNAQFLLINQPPVAKISYMPLNPKAGDRMIFSASESFDPDGEIVFFHWSFSTGYETHGEEIAFNFLTKGIYEITLTVVDNSGLFCSVSETIEITGNILSVPHSFQDVTMWCLPSSISMILNYFDINKHSWEIAKDWGWDRDVTEDYGKDNPLEISNYFEQHGLVSETFIYLITPPTFEQITEWVDLGKPILVSIKSEEHAIVIIGYDITNGIPLIIYNDPSNQDGFFEIQRWDTFSNRINHLSWLMAISSPNIYQSPKGFIDLTDQKLKLKDYNEKKDFYIPYGEIALFGEDKGLIWKNSKFVSDMIELWSVSPKSYLYFENQKVLINPTPFDQEYKLNIQFFIELNGNENIIYELSIDIQISARSQIDLSLIDPISLKSTLGEYYGELIIRLKLWNSEQTEEYDEITLPKIKYYEILKGGVQCPVNLLIIDPLGRRLGIDSIIGDIINEIPDAAFFNTSIGHQWFVIPNPLSDGVYQYLVRGKSIGHYNLSIEFNSFESNIIFNSLDLPTSDESSHNYIILNWTALFLEEKGVIVEIDSDGDGIFEQELIADSELTFDEFKLQTETKVDFNPNTLNKKSKGKWVTIYIELPNGFDVNTINLETVMLNGEIYAESSPFEIGDYDNDGFCDLMVKFDRTEVINLLPTGDEVGITISGNLVDGRFFKGTDTIQVKVKGKKNDLSLLILSVMLISMISVSLNDKKFRIFTATKKIFSII